jgi:ADP-ribose pyrophosphatase YjhB (NUDIX family)
MAKPGIRLPEAEYVRMYEATVVSRIDLWLTNPSGKVLLVQRKREPHADWWLPGGRFRPGLEPAAAAVNQVQRDLGLAGESIESLAEVGGFHYRWGMPSVGVTAQLAGFLWRGTLSSIQVADIKLSRKYLQLAWCDPAELVLPRNGHHADLARIARRVIAC